jgi:hypothetical protein
VVTAQKLRGIVTAFNAGADQESRETEEFTVVTVNFAPLNDVFAYPLKYIGCP